MTNRSNFFSEHHWRLLWMLANQVVSRYPQVEADELVNEAWLNVARRYESAVGISGWLKATMFRFVTAEIGRTTKQQPQAFEIMDTNEYPKTDDLELRDEIGSHLKGLSNRDMSICLKLASGWKPLALAKEVGLSRERIRQINNTTKQVLFDSALEAYKYIS